MFMLTCIYMCLCVYLCIRVYVYINMCMPKCVSVYFLYIYINWAFTMIERKIPYKVYKLCYQW